MEDIFGGYYGDAGEYTPAPDTGSMLGEIIGSDTAEAINGGFKNAKKMAIGFAIVVVVVVVGLIALKLIKRFNENNFGK